MGLDVEDGNKIYVTVGDCSLITVYLHEIEIKIGKKNFQGNCWILETAWNRIQYHKEKVVEFIETN